VLLHRLHYALPGWDAAAERRDAQGEFHSVAQARARADDDFDADRGFAFDGVWAARLIRAGPGGGGQRFSLFVRKSRCWRECPWVWLPKARPAMPRRDRGNEARRLWFPRRSGLAKALPMPAAALVLYML
jgi:hypothetical protein